MNKFFETSFNLNQYNQYFNEWGWLIIIALIWSPVWKGLALWHSARSSQRGWFVAILVINTVGLLEIAYLALFRKSKR